jgi:hypothetical protein
MGLIRAVRPILSTMPGNISLWMSTGPPDGRESAAGSRENMRRYPAPTPAKTEGKTPEPGQNIGETSLNHDNSVTANDLC